MKEPISLKEILAVIIRRGRSILCFALIAALLAGAYQFKNQMNKYRDPANSEEALEAAYQEALAEYESTLASLNSRLASAESKLARQEKYIEKSILMQLDSYSTAIDTMILSVTGANALIEEEAYAQKDVSPEYFISQIQEFYNIYWDSLDLSDELKKHPYPDHSNQYLQELIVFSTTEAGTFTIRCYGDTKEDASQLGDAVYNCLKKMSSVVAENTFSHKLSVVHRTTKITTSETVREKQQSGNSTRDERAQAVSDLKTEIEELVAPERVAAYGKKAVVIETAKWCVLGAVGGIVLACVWVLILFLMRNRVESSRQMEQVLGVSFLGSVAKKGDIWNRVTQKLLGERVWRNPAMAAGYIAASVKVAASSAEELAVITTLNKKDTDAALAAVAEAISSCGKITCVKDAEKNPKTVALFTHCKYAIIAERISVSEMPQVQAAMEMAKKQGVKIIGFVTI